jgi:hypothetical protein
MAKYLPMLPEGKAIQQQTKNIVYHGMKSQNANSASQLKKMK